MSSKRFKPSMTCKECLVKYPGVRGYIGKAAAVRMKHNGCPHKRGDKGCAGVYDSAHRMGQDIPEERKQLAEDLTELFKKEQEYQKKVYKFANKHRADRS